MQQNDIDPWAGMTDEQLDRWIFERLESLGMQAADELSAGPWDEPAADDFAALARACGE